MVSLRYQISRLPNFLDNRLKDARDFISRVHLPIVTTLCPVVDSVNSQGHSADQGIPRRMEVFEGDASFGQ
jgi:hypothetical protein